MKRIYIDEHSTGFEKRVYREYLKANKLEAAYQDTWCQLFKTEGYRKSVRIQEKVDNRISNILFSEFGSGTYFIRLVGSTLKHHVASGINQAYLVTINTEN